jgi:hypothetical protein
VPWAALLVAATFVAAAVRILHLVDAHAVNVLFWDQFTFYQALRDGANAWERFRWQHGPHRQGIAFVFSGWLAEQTAWNTRIEAFAIAAFAIAAAALALALRRRLFGRLEPGDVAIPLLLLTPAQYGVFLHTPNLSHGVGPLVLWLAFCLAFTLHRRALRYGALAALDFLLIHTGFGVIAGVVAPPLFALCAVCDARELGPRGALLPVGALALSGLWIAIFAIGYDPRDLDHAAGATGPVAAYVLYIALMFANVLGWKGTGALPVLGGFGALLVAVGIAVEQLVRLLRAPRASPQPLAILALLSFSLAFAAATAFGRLPLGFSGAQATRYVPLLVPAFLGIFLRVQQVARPPLRNALLAVSAVAIAAATIPMRASEALFMERLSRGKRIWVETYLATGSVAESDARAGLQIYPYPGEELPRMLAYMREHELNLFAAR